MENNKITCEKCGRLLGMIPPNGTPGVKTKGKSGKEYYPFWKCETCNWSKSTDPNPKRKSAPRKELTLADLENRCAVKFQELDEKIKHLEDLAYNVATPKVNEEFEVASQEENLPF